MKYYLSLIFLWLLVFHCNTLQGQNTDKVNESLHFYRIKYPLNEHRPIKHSVSKALDTLLQDMSIKRPRVIICRDGDSYAIYVYSTKSKIKVIAARKQLLQRFPKAKLFLSSSKSRYRLKIAHFETLTEVEKVLKQVKSDFPKAFIIPWLKRE